MDEVNQVYVHDTWSTLCSDRNAVKKAGLNLLSLCVTTLWPQLHHHHMYRYIRAHDEFADLARALGLLPFVSR